MTSWGVQVLVSHLSIASCSCQMAAATGPYKRCPGTASAFIFSFCNLLLYTPHPSAFLTLKMARTLLVAAALLLAIAGTRAAMCDAKDG